MLPLGHPAPPDPLAVIKGAYFYGEGRGRGWEGKGKGMGGEGKGEGNGRRGRRGGGGRKRRECLTPPPAKI